jgi:hypothetical protein
MCAGVYPSGTPPSPPYISRQKFENTGVARVLFSSIQDSKLEGVIPSAVGKLYLACNEEVGGNAKETGIDRLWRGNAGAKKTLICERVLRQVWGTVSEISRCGPPACDQRGRRENNMQHSVPYPQSKRINML